MKSFSQHVLYMHCTLYCTCMYMYMYCYVLYWSTKSIISYIITLRKINIIYYFTSIKASKSKISNNVFLFFRLFTCNFNINTLIIFRKLRTRWYFIFIVLNLCSRCTMEKSGEKKRKKKRRNWDKNTNFKSKNHQQNVTLLRAMVSIRG
jgi:hypothetical protein